MKNAKFYLLTLIFLVSFPVLTNADDSGKDLSKFTKMYCYSKEKLPKPHSDLAKVELLAEKIKSDSVERLVLITRGTKPAGYEDNFNCTVDRFNNEDGSADVDFRCQSERHAMRLLNVESTRTKSKWFANAKSFYLDNGPDAYYNNLQCANIKIPNAQGQGVGNNVIGEESPANSDEDEYEQSSEFANSLEIIGSIIGLSSDKIGLASITRYESITENERCKDVSYPDGERTVTPKVQKFVKKIDVAMDASFNLKISNSFEDSMFFGLFKCEYRLIEASVALLSPKSLNKLLLNPDQIVWTKSLLEIAYDKDKDTLEEIEIPFTSSLVKGESSASPVRFFLDDESTIVVNRDGRAKVKLVYKE